MGDERRSGLLTGLLGAADEAAWIEELETGARQPLAQLATEAQAFAAELQRAHGVGRAERVLLLVPPGLDWVRSFLALLLSGAAVVPAPISAPAAEIAYLAQDSGARLAIASHELSELVPGSVRVVPPQRLALGARTEGEVLDQDDALVLYTSGTTGKPKGAVLTHANLAAQTAALREAWALTPRDVLLHTLPLHHLHGVVVALATALSAGASVLIARRFEPALVASSLPRATVLMAVPTIYQRLVEHEALLADDERGRFRAAARALRLATSGSAALPASLAARWRALAGAIPLERYGMTEIGIALSNPLEASRRRPGSVGLPLPTVGIRIIGDDGLESDGPGELQVRGPSVMSRYLGREDATRSSFRDGWFLTGDIAVREAGGFVRLLGRSSTDILKTGGEKVSALEVEEVLREHDAIAEVAVVGVPDDTWGDRVVAVVVPQAGRASDCAEEPLRAWAKARLSPYKVPKQVVVVEALPRNAMGKVVKSELIRALKPPTG
jgi:malonyl-CoA/methylmalonyl-CoA synthetase